MDQRLPIDDTAVAGWQRPTRIGTTDVFVYKNTLADAPWPSGREGYFLSLWMHSPDVANELNGCQFVQVGRSGAPHPCARLTHA